MFGTTSQKVLVGVAIAVFLSVSLVFRENISRFLELGFAPESPYVKENNSSTPPIPQTGDQSVSPVASQEEKGTAEEKLKGKTTESKNTQKPGLVTSSGAPLPPYRGRDPKETRSVSEEVKLFSEEQKKQLYDSIATEAQAVKTNPIYFNGWIRLGMLKKTIGDFEGARDVWEYASLIEPLNSLSFSNLGELYWRYLHDYRKAEENLQTSIKHKSDDIQNYVTLAELYYYSYQEKYDLADDVLLDGLKANPNDETMMRRLAYLYEQRKEWAKALEWWERILTMSPDDQTVQESIAKVKLRLEGQNK